MLLLVIQGGASSLQGAAEEVRAKGLMLGLINRLTVYDQLVVLLTNQQEGEEASSSTTQPTYHVTRYCTYYRRNTANTGGHAVEEKLAYITDIELVNVIN